MPQFSFANLDLANLAAARWRALGLDAVVLDEHLSSVAWPLLLASGIRVAVTSPELDETEILRLIQADAIETHDVPAPDPDGNLEFESALDQTSDTAAAEPDAEPKQAPLSPHWLPAKLLLPVVLSTLLLSVVFLALTTGLNEEILTIWKEAFLLLSISLCATILILFALGELFSRLGALTLILLLVAVAAAKILLTDLELTEDLRLHQTVKPTDFLWLAFIIPVLFFGWLLSFTFSFWRTLPGKITMLVIVAAWLFPLPHNLMLLHWWLAILNSF